MKKYLACFILLLVYGCVSGQVNKQKELLKEVVELKKLLDQMDTITGTELWNDTARNFHQEIGDRLVKILSDPLILKYNQDSLLQHSYLGITSSSDKKISVVSWFEKTGGSFHSYLSVVQYMDANLPKAFFQYFYEDDAFPTQGGTISEIYRLRHPSKKLYLFIGSVKGCNSCFAHFAFVAEIKMGKLSNYPAFTDRFQQQTETVFLLENRRMEIMEFKYLPGKQSLYFEYSEEEGSFERDEYKNKIHGQQLWNGSRFVLKTWK